MPLLVPRHERSAPVQIRPSAPGHEQVIAVLFCDMRNFTTIADQRLPYDIVFLLNRYFAIVGEAVEKAGGRLDKFIGDGAMALFGLESAPGEACRQALAAGRAIIAGAARLSDELSGEISLPVHVAIGIHVGPAIVGSMGFGTTMGVTAIGDTVNISSRLEVGRQGIRRRHRHFRSRREAFRHRFRGVRIARHRHSRPGTPARRLCRAPRRRGSSLKPGCCPRNCANVRPRGPDRVSPCRARCRRDPSAGPSSARWRHRCRQGRRTAGRPTAAGSGLARRSAP